MDAIFNNILTILIMNGSILIIPGVNFLLVARQSVLNGASSGIYCASGITTAIVFHALLAALSVQILVKYPFIFAGVRYMGAAYLLYLGTTFLRKAIQNAQTSMEGVNESAQKQESFRSGFFVDLFNPFISIFYLSLFSSFTFSQNPAFELSCYISVILAISIVWFSLVALFFNHPLIRDNLQSKSRYIQALSGLAMYYFSAKVIFQF